MLRSAIGCALFRQRREHSVHRNNNYTGKGNSTCPDNSVPWNKKYEGIEKLPVEGMQSLKTS